MFFSYSFQFLLLHHSIVARSDFHIESTIMMGMWLVPILLMMVVVGSRFGGGNDEDEEIGSGTYHGEEEDEGKEE